MSVYLPRLLEHVESGGKLVGVPNRPVSRGLLKRVVDTCYSPLKRERPLQVFPGTSLYRIRPGLVINHVIGGLWHTLLGRICPPGEVIDSSHRSKTVGGMTENRDFSIFCSLMREMREEVYSFMVHRGSVFPLSVIPSRKGVMPFFCGRFKNYPDIGQGRFVPVEESDGWKTYMGYMSVDSLVDEYAKGDDAIVHPETVEAALVSYFWGRSRKVDFSDDDVSGGAGVTDRGELKIPGSIRDSLIDLLGLDEDYRPDLSRCAVYLSVPTQVRSLPSARMLLLTDTFMYEEEFGPEMFGDDCYDSVEEEAEDVVKEQAGSRFEEILLEDIPSMYSRDAAV